MPEQDHSALLFDDADEEAVPHLPQNESAGYPGGGGSGFGKSYPGGLQPMRDSG